MGTPAAAIEQYKLSQRLQAIAQLKARKAWALVQVGLLTASWETILRNTGLVEDVSSLQLEAATAGASYGARSLASQGEYVAPEAFVNPAAFAGIAADGRSLEGLLWSPVPRTKQLIKGGSDPLAAKVSGGKFLELIVKTTVADAGRGAAGVDIATRPGVGYIRFLNPPSCSRCSVLAGRFYRWNAGFKRHPGCDCIHAAAKATEALKSEGLIHNPKEYFDSLSEAEQNKVYTKDGAQAIRDGADIFQTVNSQRGMSYSGVAKDGTNRGLKRSLTTTEGTSRRGNYGAGRGPRLTPEAIYSKDLPREQTLKLLDSNGYMLPGGQQPMGVLRGDREGYGALGRGGTRVGARQAVQQARNTGVRDPGSRYTMTEAERRLSNARLEWSAMLEGRNPRGKGPLTPQLKADIEDNFRRWVATNGEVFR